MGKISYSYRNIKNKESFPYNIAGVSVDKVIECKIISDWSNSESKTTLDEDGPWRLYKSSGSSSSMQEMNHVSKVNNHGDGPYSISVFKNSDNDATFFRKIKGYYSTYGSASVLVDKYGEALYHPMYGLRSDYSSDENYKMTYNLTIDNGQYIHNQNFILAKSQFLNEDLIDPYMNKNYSGLKKSGETWYTQSISLGHNCLCFKFIVPSDAPGRDMILASEEIMTVSSPEYGMFFAMEAVGGNHYSTEYVLDMGCMVVNKDTSYMRINDGGKSGYSFVLKYEGPSRGHVLHVCISNKTIFTSRIKKSQFTLSNIIDDGYSLTTNDINEIVIRFDTIDKYGSYDYRSSPYSYGYIHDTNRGDLIIQANNSRTVKYRALINSVYSEDIFVVPDYNPIEICSRYKKNGIYSDYFKSGIIYGNRTTDMYDGNISIINDGAARNVINENGDGSNSIEFLRYYTPRYPFWAVTFGGYNFEGYQDFQFHGLVGAISSIDIDLSVDMEGLDIDTFISIGRREEEASMAIEKNSIRAMDIRNINGVPFIEEYVTTKSIRQEDIKTLKANLLGCAACEPKHPIEILPNSVTLRQESIVCIGDEYMGDIISSPNQLPFIVSRKDKNIINIDLDAKDHKSFIIDENLIKLGLSYVDGEYTDIYGMINDFAMTIRIKNLGADESIELTLVEFNQEEYIAHMIDLGLDVEKTLSVPEILNKTSVVIVNEDDSYIAESFITKNLWMDTEGFTNIKRELRGYYTESEMSRYIGDYGHYIQTVNTIVIPDDNVDVENPHKNVSEVSVMKTSFSDGAMMTTRGLKFHIKYNNHEDMNSEYESNIVKVSKTREMPSEESLREYVKNLEDSGFDLSFYYEDYIVGQSENIPHEKVLEIWEDRDILHLMDQSIDQTPYSDIMIDNILIPDKCVFVKKSAIISPVISERSLYG